MNYPLFFLMDAARTGEENLSRALALNTNAVSLYSGRAEEELSLFGPWLFSFPGPKDFFNLIVQSGWSNAWGVIVQAASTFENVRRHFDKFLLVKTAEGEEMYFRFYDPRVLRLFLPTCNAEQLQAFFAGIDRFICEDEDPDSAILFSIKRQQLVTEKRPAKEIFSILETQAGSTDNLSEQLIDALQQGGSKRRLSYEE